MDNTLIPEYCWYTISNIDDGTQLLMRFWWKRFKYNTQIHIKLENCDTIASINMRSPLSDPIVWDCSKEQPPVIYSVDKYRICRGLCYFKRQYTVWKENPNNIDKPFLRRDVQNFINCAKIYNKCEILHPDTDIYFEYLININC